LAGFRPHADIEIVFTGLRPGEKLYEELFDPSEVNQKDPDVPYFVASPRVIDKDVLHKTLAVLEGAIANEDQVRAVELLNHIVPEYTPVGPVMASASSGFELEGKVARKPPSRPKPVA
jgi:O-antigen biosynthesis protein WbqV